MVREETFEHTTFGVSFFKKINSIIYVFLLYYGQERQKKVYFKEEGREWKKSPYKTLPLSDPWRCYGEPERTNINSLIL